MNMTMLLIVAALVVFVFMFSGGKVEKKGGKSVIHSFPTNIKSGARFPKVLKDNKQMLLGVVVGLLLSSFFGVRIEDFGRFEEMLSGLFKQEEVEDIKG